MKQIKYLVAVLALLLCAALLCACSDDKTCPDGAHTPGSWTVATEATCSAEGKETTTCTVCGAEMERTLEATGKHTYGEWEVVKNATFTDEGEKKRTCTGCNTAFEVEPIRALGAGPEVMTSAGTRDVDLSEFEIIYNDTVPSVAIAARAGELSKVILEMTGLEVAVQKQSIINDGGGSFEILLGLTNRPESIEAFGDIKGDGFAVRVIDQKVVIVGSDDLQTLSGLQYFIDTYLAEPVESGVLRMNESATANYATVVTLLTQGSNAQLEIIYDKAVDSDLAHGYVAGASNSRDYPCVAAEQLAAHLKTLATLQNTVPYHDDTTTASLELLIGTADRPEAKSFLAVLDGNEYGILVTEDKVLLMAHCDYALQMCVDQFKELLNTAAGTDENGTMIWKLPLGFRMIGEANPNVVTDFPRPEGIALYNSLYLNHNAMQYMYLDDTLTAERFAAYRTTLLNAGYRVVNENEIQESQFLTLVNDEKQIMLYVAFNAYAHADEAHNRDDSMHVTKYAYRDYVKCIRVVSAPLDSAYMPPTTLFTKQAYTKLTESSITTVRMSGSAVGHAYIILLEDGSFVVIDGGNNYGDATDLVWGSLSALHTEVYGSAPSVSNPVRVRAWYVTHSHGDHYGNFINVMKTRYPTSDLKVDYVVGNFPEKMSIYSVVGDTYYMGQDSVLANVKMYGGGTQYVKVYAGQILYFANLKMEVLMTYADHAPWRIDNSNDTNTVTRLTFDHQNTAAAKATWVILGDSCVYASRWLCAMYGDYLQSDMVQLAHHGNIGCENALYKLISPTVIWYPHNSGGFNGYANASKKNQWPHNVTYYVTRTLESVKYIYTEGIAGRAGTEALTLKFKADGTGDYDNVYNPIKGTKYSYHTTPYSSTSPAIKLR